jgi:hypothetical protein
MAAAVSAAAARAEARVAASEKVAVAIMGVHGRGKVLAGLLTLGLAPATAAEPFCFMQLSDPQFGMFTDDADFRQKTANFEFAIATANRLRPAFVVVTGDLINKCVPAPSLVRCDSGRGRCVR